MKIILIALNLLLGTAVLWSGARLFRQIRGDRSKVGFTVKKRKTAPKKIIVPPVRETASEKTASTPDEQLKKIVRANIFNPERCPNTAQGGNARVELTLVGTFKIGQTAGAVILQKSQTRNNAFMPFGMPFDMNNQTGGRRMGIGSGTVTSGRGGSSNTGTRRQIGGSRSLQAVRNANGAIQPGTAAGTAAVPTSFQQYVRLGETLSNGYKLVEVERTRAVLTRGGDKLELELSDASKNMPQKAVRNNQRTNQTQVMQQMLRSMQNMQRMQMMQGFQMMRGMQQQQNNRQGGRSGAAPRGR